MQEYISHLNDSSPIVRGAVVDALSQINSTEYVSYFLPLLEDKKRSIRIKAFFGLAGLLESEIPEVYYESYQKVKKEFFLHLKTNADFVGAKIKKGNYYLKKKQLKKAIECYESALEIDHINNQVRINLATLYYNDKNYLKAEQAFKTVIAQEPNYGPAYYSLALMYAELNKIDAAIYQLNKAKELMPNNIRIYYNLGLLFHKNNDVVEAEKAFIAGLKIDSQNESLLYSLVYLYSKSNQKEKAKNILKRLINLYPNNQQYTNFLNGL